MAERTGVDLTEEDFAETDEQVAVLEAIHEAQDRGDRAGELALNKKLLVPAESLMAAKRSMGADWVRERGYNTRLADEKYGEGWLDR